MKIKKCRYCEKTNCTGEIEDHCTWCGQPCRVEDAIFSLEALEEADYPRFCASKCFDENKKWDDESRERWDKERL